MFKKKIPCRYCSQTHTVKKHGTARSGHQRYLCQHCNKTFQVKYIYSAYKNEKNEQVENPISLKERRAKKAESAVMYFI